MKKGKSALAIAQGRSLAMLRKRHPLSQSQLLVEARAVDKGLPFKQCRTIGQMEAGERIIDKRSANAFAQALGCTVEEILAPSEEAVAMMREPLQIPDMNAVLNPCDLAAIFTFIGDRQVTMGEVLNLLCIRLREGKAISPR